MENQYQIPFITSYSDSSTDGSCGSDSCNSGDSNNSVDFGIKIREQYDMFEDNNIYAKYNRPSLASVDSLEVYPNISPNDPNPISFFAPFAHPRLRPESVSSPSPQQVAVKVAPFLHLRADFPWCPQGWTPANQYLGNGIPRQNSNSTYGYFQQSEPISEHFEDLWTAAAGAPGMKPRPRLSTCDDPLADLMRNGRDVAMDDLDKLQIGQRELAAQQRQNLLEHYDEMEGSQHDQEPSLRLRLAKVRAMIRGEIAQLAALKEAQGIYGPRKKDKLNAKKCKFCLKKKEREDIVTHHNLRDSMGLVACPILQQYKCDLCNATGKHAHTIKYCPRNNPETSHDEILRARLNVMKRNRRGQ